MEMQVCTAQPLCMLHLNNCLGVMKSIMGELTDSTNRVEGYGLLPAVWIFLERLSILPSLPRQLNICPIRLADCKYHVQRSACFYLQPCLNVIFYDNDFRLFLQTNRSILH